MNIIVADSEEIFGKTKVIAALYLPFLIKTIHYILTTNAIIPP